MIINICPPAGPRSQRRPCSGPSQRSSSSVPSPGITSSSENLRKLENVWADMKSSLSKKDLSALLKDEGQQTPDLKTLKMGKNNSISEGIKPSKDKKIDELIQIERHRRNSSETPVKNAAKISSCYNRRAQTNLREIVEELSESNIEIRKSDAGMRKFSINQSQKQAVSSTETEKKTKESKNDSKIIPCKVIVEVPQFNSTKRPEKPKPKPGQKKQDWLSISDFKGNSVNSERALQTKKSMKVGPVSIKEKEKKPAKVNAKKVQGIVATGQAHLKALVGAIEKFQRENGVDLQHEIDAMRMSGDAMIRKLRSFE